MKLLGFLVFRLDQTDSSDLTLFSSLSAYYFTCPFFLLFSVFRTFLAQVILSPEARCARLGAGINPGAYAARLANDTTL